MLYMDTSIIAAYYCPEILSEKVEHFILSRKERLTISNLSEIELYSAISRKIREKNLETIDGKKILNKFENHIKEKYFTKLILKENHYKKAKEWISRFDNSLKTVDALHLALSDCEKASIVTLDKKLLASARLLNVDYIEIES